MQCRQLFNIIVTALSNNFRGSAQHLCSPQEQFPAVILRMLYPIMLRIKILYHIYSINANAIVTIMGLVRAHNVIFHIKNSLNAPKPSQKCCYKILTFCSKT